MARWLLGAFLLFAGIGHLTFSQAQFLAQVPTWLPLQPDFVVVASGIVEIALGIGLLAFKRYRGKAGLATAVFLVVVFPGNIAQFTEHRDAFGLNTDEARAIRLIFQPVLVLWALWSTSAISYTRERFKGKKR
jgi:hypothetical protein